LIYLSVFECIPPHSILFSSLMIVINRRGRNGDTKSRTNILNINLNINRHSNTLPPILPTLLLQISPNYLNYIIIWMYLYLDKYRIGLLIDFTVPLFILFQHPYIEWMNWSSSLLSSILYYYSSIDYNIIFVKLLSIHIDPTTTTPSIHKLSQYNIISNI